jgi:predicted porin
MKARLCLAVGAALLPALSLAQGSFYGSARIGGVFLDQSATLPADKVDDFQISSADTRIGYAGEEDLRENLMAIYQIEAGLNLDTNDTEIEVRESFVGIGGEWGRAVAGRLNSPFENILGQDGWGFNDQLRSFDPFEDTIGDVNALLGYDLFQLRYDNSLRYQSPGFGNFSFAAQYVTDADQTGAIEDNDNSVYSLGLSWGIENLWFSLGLEQLNSGSDVVPEPMGVRLGVGGNITEKFTIGALYELLDGDDVAALERDSYTAFTTFRFGENNGRQIRFAYTLAEDNDLIEDSGAEMWSAGYYCLPADDLEFHVVYSALENDANAFRLGPLGAEPFGLGVGAESGTFLPGVAGEDQQAIELGLRYNF